MGKKVMIVDDSTTEIALIRASLKGGGYAFIEATDGEQALQIARVEKPDLIVLDVIIPKLNGFQVCRALKSDTATADIKIVLISTKSQESDRFWGLKQGADEYVTKPFEDQDLLNTVKRFL